MSKGFLSRREFIKLTGGALLGFFLSDLPLDNVQAAHPPLQGRVVYRSLIVRDAPAFSGMQINSILRDRTVDIIDQVFGGAEGDYNRIWYKLGNGSFVYSGGVQPVNTQLNHLVPDIPSTGVLGEITIPFADSFWAINRSPSPGPRLYYGSTHWIDGLVTDQRDGTLWYKAYDNIYNSHYFTRPEWIHIYSAGGTFPAFTPGAGNRKTHRNLPGSPGLAGL